MLCALDTAYNFGVPGSDENENTVIKVEYNFEGVSNLGHGIRKTAMLCVSIFASSFFLINRKLWQDQAGLLIFSVSHVPVRERIAGRLVRTKLENFILLCWSSRHYNHRSGCK